MEKKEKTNTGKYHVTRHPDGGWQVILGGGSQSYSSHQNARRSV